MPTPSDIKQLSAVRDGVLRRPGLRCLELRSALCEAYDQWFAGIVSARPGIALACVGGYGRRELAPYSDLDLMLLHEGNVEGLTELADSIWYPVWDSGIGLDHSVRTVEQAVAVAEQDLKAVLGMLDIRHVAGDESLTASVRQRVRERWRITAPARSAEMHAAADERAAAHGEAAFLLAPNLKASRGGMRDAQAIHALALAQLIDMPPTVRLAYSDLLDIRGQLQRLTGKPSDVLALQEQDAIAVSLEMFDEDGRPDRDAVLLQANSAARAIAHALDASWRRVRPPERRRLFGRAHQPPVRMGLAQDVVAHDGEVVLAVDVEPPYGGELLLRTARAAAENGLPIADATLARLKAGATSVDKRWSQEMRSDFVALLGAGEPAVGVLEAMDLSGLLELLIPEWVTVRSKAQHNPVHRFTVDRHLLEVAAQAARHARRLDRPDLLLISALLHDIGKGAKGDHSVAGMPIAAGIADRMGLSADDAAIVSLLVRHHLLLAHTATRRDADDPATVRIITDAVGDDGQLLDLLHALTVADALGTGPAAWSDWKAALVNELVRRARLAQRGIEQAPPPPLDRQRAALVEAGEVAVVVGEDDVVVAAPDRVGTLYRAAGVLALNLLDVRSASIQTHAGMAVNRFSVAPRFGRMPDPARLREELVRTLDGDAALGKRLREKERSYAKAVSAELEPATVHWFDDEATDATVLEYRAPDEIGLLCRITAALERCQLDVRGARVESLAGSVVDSFYVTTRSGAVIPPELRGDIEAELLRA